MLSKITISGVRIVAYDSTSLYL